MNTPPPVRALNLPRGAPWWTIPLPFDRPPAALWGNAREGHWAPRHKATLAVRSAVVLLGRLLKVPPGDHLTVLLVWAPGDRRVRDEDNLAPFYKVICDALGQSRGDWVGLQLVRDDSPKYMTKLAPKIIPPPHKGMWLFVQVASG